ncbi:MAG: aminotransferase class V-fold PLP-dependent enzyme [Methanomassiliicoccales archaeon]
MLEKESLDLLRKALDHMEAGFLDLPDIMEQRDERAEAVLLEVAQKMRDNYPYFHPLYAGQMIKPPHPLARTAYMLAMWINPNNHALDGGKASSLMEKQAVAQMASMYGWSEHLGHLTGGGTLANLEALYVAGQIHPGKKVLASQQAHYTHSRLSHVLGLNFHAVPSDDRGKMDLAELEALLRQGDVGTVVATMGTTGTGSVDPLPQLLELRERYGFRLHADAAYGGYFVLARNLDPETERCLDCLGEVDSIVVDPHKHGLQPYGCGCILYRDPSMGQYYQHDSPYTYFTSKELHLGEISLECSRPGAAAVALWATLRLLPLVKGGEFALGLEKGRAAALKLQEMVRASNAFRAIMDPELDILVFAPVGSKASEISARTEGIFAKAEALDLHLAKFRMPSSTLRRSWPEVEFDQEEVVCLRSCLMKPEHLEWVEEIMCRLERAAD